MSRGALLCLISMLPLGCEARDVTVFEVASGGDVARAGSGGGDGGRGGNSGSGGRSDSGGSSDNHGGTDNNAAGDGGAPSLSGTGGGGGSAGGGSSGGGDMTCTSNKDCPQDYYCEKTSCDAPTGSCSMRPKHLTLDYAPVCGCDGVTYWNDVVRRQIGQALYEAAKCSTTARACDFGPDCGLDFMSCSRLLSRGDSCGAPAQGVCWTLPPYCPDPKTDPDVWQECRPGSPPGSTPCIDTCNAIRSERPQQQPPDPTSMCPTP
ncbi:MAG TPA: hypothetical protein VEQ58_23195 [Polyangiaceae bacterium]|nr:hypothetical protein [Polyangiaceae bacterium]